MMQLQELVPPHQTGTLPPQNMDNCSTHLNSSSSAQAKPTHPMSRTGGTSHSHMNSGGASHSHMTSGGTSQHHMNLNSSGANHNHMNSSSNNNMTELGKIPNNDPDQTHQCANCKNNIKDRYLLKALDQFWHEDCLKCSCCDCRLGEVGATLYTKANLLLCRRDYLRLFGTTGHCSACRKMIPAFELVMRAKGNVYHLECFACQQCNHRFCVGDRFYLCDNKILCEYDYEERMIFANMQFHNNNNNSSGYNALHQMKQQTESLSDSSSGYSSPSPGTL